VHIVGPEVKGLTMCRFFCILKEHFVNPFPGVRSILPLPESDRLPQAGG